MKNPPVSGEQFWFFNTLVNIRLSYTAKNDSISILEHRAPLNDSPPLHIHTTEDEIFNILEGEFTLKTGDEVFTLGAGDIKVVPKGEAHTYKVESGGGGHWMTITVNGDFEKFVREMSRPAERSELPEPSGPPDAEEARALAEKASKFGIKIVGAPLH